MRGIAEKILEKRGTPIKPPGGYCRYVARVAAKYACRRGGVHEEADLEKIVGVVMDLRGRPSLGWETNKDTMEAQSERSKDHEPGVDSVDFVPGRAVTSLCKVDGIEKTVSASLTELHLQIYGSLEARVATRTVPDVEGTPERPGTDEGAEVGCVPPAKPVSILGRSRFRRTRLEEEEIEARVRVPTEHTIAAVSQSLSDVRAAIDLAPNSMIKKSLESEEQYCADNAWIEFQRVIGVPEPVQRFSKKTMDVGVESIFGSIDTSGVGYFDFGGRRWTDSYHDAHAFFSLYLGRKVFPCATVAGIESAGHEAIKRLSTPEEPRDERRDRAVTIIRELAKDIFSLKSLNRRKDDPQWDCPVHDTAAYEGPHKRDMFYARSERKKPIHGHVKVVPIKSGGKIRVITTDSYENMEFAYLNKWMSECLFKERWSIFGRTVEEWMQARPDFAAWEENFLSGDLESATDLFSPEMAEAVFEVIAAVDAESRGEENDSYERELVERLKGFTTRAILEFRSAGGKQSRGQLMGSIVSFPILCLVSLVAWLMSEDLDVPYLQETCPKKRKALRKLWLVGVNGDDLVAAVRDRGEKWSGMVPAVGGRASRGKTLVNDKAFTVNSELWIREQGAWLAPGSIRPSLLLGIADGRRANPCVLWDSYRHSRITLAPGVKELVESRMKPHLPVSLGGVGGFRMFVEEDVRAAYDRRLTDSTRQQTRHFWKSIHTLRAHSDRQTRKIVLVDREQLPKINKELFRPYAGTVRYAERGVIPLIPSGVSTEFLEAWYNKQWDLEEAGKVLMYLPFRVRSLLEIPPLSTSSVTPGPSLLDKWEDFWTMIDVPLGPWTKRRRGVFAEGGGLLGVVETAEEERRLRQWVACGRPTRSFNRS